MKSELFGKFFSILVSYNRLYVVKHQRQTPEVWLPILDGVYELSNYGIVRSLRSGHGTFVGRVLKQFVVKGYLSVTLSTDGKLKTYPVHILVARHFIGPCPKGKEVNHKDLNKLNPFVKNLEYVTSSQNKTHAIANGVCFQKGGELHGRSKLTLRKVIRLRKLYREKGLSLKLLGKKFGLHSSTVWSVVNNKTWKVL